MKLLVFAALALLFIMYAASAQAVVSISELLPSPESGEKEWIELYNDGSNAVDLAEWKLKDKSGNILTISATSIDAKTYLVVTIEKTKLSLNNDGDKLSLMAAQDIAMDSVTYRDAPRGQSYANRNGEWKWTTTLTPGNPNIFPLPLPRAESLKPAAPAPQQKVVVPKPATPKPKNGPITLTGIVTAAPGTIGARVMYLTNVESENEIPKNLRLEVPSFTKAQIGNVVTATGKIRTSAGQPYLMVAAGNDLTITNEISPVEPMVFAQGAEINSLVTMEGKLQRKTSRGFVLSAEGAGDVTVTLPTGVPKPDGVQTKIKVAGIYAPSGVSDRLLVRTAEDIMITTPPQAHATPKNSDSPSSQWPSALQTGTVAMVAGTAGAIWWWLTQRRNRSTIQTDDLPYELVDDDDDTG